jgi:hypothetical protein
MCCSPPHGSKAFLAALIWFSWGSLCRISPHCFLLVGSRRGPPRDAPAGGRGSPRRSQAACFYEHSLVQKARPCGHPEFQSHRERTRAVPLPAERSAVQSSMRRTMRTSIVRRSLGSRSVSTSSLPKNRQPVIVSAVRTPIGRCVSGSPPSLLQPGPGRRDPRGAEHQDSYPVAHYPLCCHGAALAPALSRSRLAGTPRGVSRRL